MYYDLQTGRMLLRKRKVGNMIIGQLYASHTDEIQAMVPYQELEKRLLEFGGRALVFRPMHYILMASILEHGQPFDASGAKNVKGEPSNCHQNVVDQWRKHPNTYRMVHGYGLSADGLWRNHSWLLDAKDRVIETTVPRVMYYGFILEGDLEDWFAESES